MKLKGHTAIKLQRPDGLCFQIGTDPFKNKKGTSDPFLLRKQDSV